MLRYVLLSLQAGNSSNVNNLVRVVASLSSESRSVSAYVSQQSRHCKVFQGAERYFCDAAQFSTRQMPIKHDAGPPTTSVYADEQDEKEQFGGYTKDYSTRTSFRKMSPEQHNLKYTDTREEDSVVKKFKSKTGRRNTAYWYFLQCKNLVAEDNLAEALALFEGDMLKGERLQPEEYNYTVLIGGCGRVGYVKKAFQLYNNMKKRGLVPSDATYTALFNACAESPWKLTGLAQAQKLRQELRRKNVHLAAITQHAFLKTVALAGDLKACFQVLREMLQNGQPITQETFQYLLMCCVEDKQQGFRLALQVWHQMLNAGLKPDTQNYNILLRAARDCGIGDLALASTLLLRGQEEPASKVSPQSRGQKSKVSKEPALDMDVFESHVFTAAMSVEPKALDTAPHDQWQPRNGTLGEIDAEPVGGGATDDLAQHRMRAYASDSTHETQLTTAPPRNDITIASPFGSRPPNLLDPSTCHSDVVALGTVNGASDRLVLMGDLEGFLKRMANDGLRPTIKTLTLLAEVVEPGSQSAQSLISVAKQSQVRLDVAFFNTLIRKSAKAGDLEGAKAMKALMLEMKQAVNAQTFCAVALACGRQKDALQLLSDMEDSGIAANTHVFSALIGQAMRHLDYAYLHELLKQMHRLQVSPNEVIIRQLEFAAQYPPTFDKFKSKNTYLEKIDGFRGFYREWLKFMPGQETPHPWEKYRLPQTEDQPHGTCSQSHRTSQSSQ